jgi:transcriptional regulator with XRE-family HTH domain
MVNDRFDIEYREHVAQMDTDPDLGTQYVLLAVVDKIEELMASQGVTQVELAQRLGVSRARISALLNGQPNTSVRTLMRIAYALDVIIDVSFGKPGALRQRARDEACVWHPSPSRSDMLAYAAVPSYDYLEATKECCDALPAAA